MSCLGQSMVVVLLVCILVINSPTLELGRELTSANTWTLEIEVPRSVYSK